MAPDRGVPAAHDDPEPRDEQHDNDSITSSNADEAQQEPNDDFLTERSKQSQFTLRSVLLGLVIGIMIAFSNTYFGLQTGWISGMAMPSALIGFTYFKGLRTLIDSMGGPLKSLGLGVGFTEVENVLVQTVAGAVGTMPLGCGFVGVIPALEYLLEPGETPNATTTDVEMLTAIASGERSGGLRLPQGKLMLWALGICFFGVMFAVPLRKQVIIREKLKFPTGTATALMIQVLHGGQKEEAPPKKTDDEESQALISGDTSSRSTHLDASTLGAPSDWKKQIKLLTTSFAVSGAYTLATHFVPQLHNIPIFGTYLASSWLWTLNPSPAYVGQGIIMGPATTIHMFLGAVLGWAILSPIAKHEGWAPGNVDDWKTGSKGWIVWVSLAIMLADALVSLGWLVLKPLIWYARTYGANALDGIRDKGVHQYFREMTHLTMRGYSPVQMDDPIAASSRTSKKRASPSKAEHDAPPEHLIGPKTTSIGLVLSLVFCVVAIQLAFPGVISVSLTIFALFLAMILSIMGVRALGETDLNPVSGISKLTQLLFALVTPSGSKNAIVINLLAGAISESGALQAGDLLQDLKTGHLLGASPKAQFMGQLIGSAAGAVLSAAVYKLYTRVYTIPSDMFQVPTGFVWIFTARLVTGAGLPPKIAEFAAVAAAVWAALTALRIYGNSRQAPWVPYIPGGIAVAVGMYNTPSFTLARTIGGLITWWWTRWKGRPETPVVVLASGLILGEGLFSIVKLALTAAEVPHL
ncbi:hypothetical protein AMS68_003229 [Peltaster fructicola]|uniref:OPT superfamily oligopeptide transporter n=1 Tax=Peltaster fructicola TaxID=286661 RepID=A0A6H0XSG5_9PEZI|nr:hypothetical protein AMS68_003229 [Peltaster fructicola]